jgi:hypothetical protein
MEADWEFEVGGDAPAIEAAWAGFIDLQLEPVRARELPEAAQLPGLAEALIQLNEAASPVWTSKCDVWPSLEPGEFDSDELDAPSGSSAHAMGCYIDLLAKTGGQWLEPETVAAACKKVCGLLHKIPLRCCRADLVIRRTFLTPDPEDQYSMLLGVTVYLTSCGASQEAAGQTLQAALAALAGALRASRS